MACSFFPKLTAFLLISSQPSATETGISHEHPLRFLGARIRQHEGEQGGNATLDNPSEIPREERAFGPKPNSAAKKFSVLSQLVSRGTQAPLTSTELHTHGARQGWCSSSASEDACEHCSTMQTRSGSQTTAVNTTGAEDTSGASRFLVSLLSQPAPAPPTSHSSPLPVRAEPRTVGCSRLFGAPPLLPGRAQGPRWGHLAQRTGQDGGTGRRSSSYSSDGHAH